MMERLGRGLDDLEPSMNKLFKIVGKQKENKK